MQLDVVVYTIRFFVNWITGNAEDMMVSVTRIVNYRQLRYPIKEVGRGATIRISS
jgi:hypothetical protein